MPVHHVYRCFANRFLNCWCEEGAEGKWCNYRNYCGMYTLIGDDEHIASSHKNFALRARRFDVPYIDPCLHIYMSLAQIVRSCKFALDFSRDLVRSTNFRKSFPHQNSWRLSLRSVWMDTRTFRSFRPWNPLFLISVFRIIVTFILY